MREGDDLIRKMLSARACGNSERCASENLMAAYLESSLSPQETAEFEAHVADCAICREVLALSMKMDSEDTADRPVVATNTRRALFHFFIPVVVAGALFLVFIAVIFKYMRNPSEDNIQVAEVRKPTQMPAQRPVQETETTTQQARREISETKAPETKAADSEDFKEKELRAAKNFDVLEKQKIDERIAEGKAKEMLRADAGREAASGLSSPMPNATMPPAPAAPEKDKAAAESATDEKTAVEAAPAPLKEPKRTDLFSAVTADDVRFGYVWEPEKESSEIKKIGDKVFYRNSKMWIDRQCSQHQGSQMIEILPAVPEYKSILSRYPELRDLLPAMIYWNSKNYLLH